MEGQLQYLPILGQAALKIDEASALIKPLLKTVKSQLVSKSPKYITEILTFVSCGAMFPDMRDEVFALGINTLLFEYLNLDALQEKQTNQLLDTLFEIYKHKESDIEALESLLFENLKAKRKDSKFIEKVFLRFFEFEHTKMVKFVSEDAPTPQLMGQLPEPSQKKNGKHFDFPSKFMTEQHRTTLSGALLNLVDEKSVQLMEKHSWEKVVETSADGEDFSEILKGKLFSEAPFLILLNCICMTKPCLMGIYSPTGFKKNPDNTNEGEIPNSDNTFIFYYQETTLVHYKIESSELFLEYNVDEVNRSIRFSHEGTDKIMISLAPDVKSTIDMYPMTPIAEDNNPDLEFPYDVHLNSLQIFQLRVLPDTNKDTHSAIFYQKLDTSLDTNSRLNRVNSIYSDALIFDIQEEMSLKNLQEALGVRLLGEHDPAKKLQDFKEVLLVLETDRQVNQIPRGHFDKLYNPRFPIFEVFLKKGGMIFIIESIMKNKNIKFLAKDDLKENWRQLMSYLLELQQLDGFMSSMIANSEFKSIVFELFIAADASKRDWKDADFKISRLIFEKLSLILKNTDSIQTRINFFEIDVLGKLLSKLRSLTSEIKREYDDTPEKVIQVIKKKEESLLKDIKKKKGVGYDKEGSGQKWMISEYLKNKKIKNEFVIYLLQLF